MAAQLNYTKKLESCYDGNGLLTRYPSKRPLRPIVLSRIAEEFVFGKEYSEKEVNAIIQSKIAFSDIELIRRELIENKYLGRMRDGSKYWREEPSVEMNFVQP